MDEGFESARGRPTRPLRRYVASYQGYRQSGGQPGRHRGSFAYVTFIVTLDDPVEIAEPSDPRQPPHAYETLIGGLPRRRLSSPTRADNRAFSWPSSHSEYVRC